MRAVSRILRMLGLLSLLTPAARVHAQGIGEKFADIKVGRWIQLEGVPQKDQTLWCAEVKVLTGDFLDDDWRIRGVVQSVDPRAHKFTIARFLVQPKNDVDYDDKSGAIKSFDDLKIGQLVEVEGTYMKGGTFLAKEIENQFDKLTRKPGIERKIRVAGKVEKVDAAKRSITMMSATFLVTERTQFKSVLK